MLPHPGIATTPLRGEPGDDNSIWRNSSEDLSEALLQRLVPLDMIGRVASLDFFVSIAFMPVSIAIAGPLSLLVPIPIIFVIAGVIPPALALIALLAGRMRQTEDSQPLDAD